MTTSRRRDFLEITTAGIVLSGVAALPGAAWAQASPKRGGTLVYAQLLGEPTRR
jgi:hypothetical protein